jgi:DNA repair protein RadD
MIPSFKVLLSRADESVLQELIDRRALRAYNRRRNRDLPPSELRDVILNAVSAEALVRSKSSREALISLLRPVELREILAQPAMRGATIDKVLDSGPKSKIVDQLLVLLDVRVALTPDLVITPDEATTTSAYALFKHQRRASQEVYQGLSAYGSRVLLHMPTGSGKTRTAIDVVCRFLREQEPTLVMWLATSEELCEQAASEFETAWQNLGNRELKTYRFWGSHEYKMSNESDGFIVAGLSKLNAAAKNDVSFLARLGSRVRLMVFDEAHQTVAPVYRDLVETVLYANRNGTLLGLTATPGRTWNLPDDDRELSEFFHGKKVSLQVDGYDNVVEYLIEAGYLARPKFRSLRYKSEQKLTDSEERALAGQLEVPVAILRKLADDEIRNLQIIAELEALAGRHKRIIVFAATVAHAEFIALTLQTLGVDARSVTGETPSGEREARIAWYKSGAPEVRVLTNYGVLTTGFDAPATSATLIARPTKSLVLYSQMVGRAVRGTLAGGNKDAEIVTVVDTTLPGFGELKDAFFHWEDVW